MIPASLEVVKLLRVQPLHILQARQNLLPVTLDRLIGFDQSAVDVREDRRLRSEVKEHRSTTQELLDVAPLETRQLEGRIAEEPSLTARPLDKGLQALCPPLRVAPLAQLNLASGGAASGHLGQAARRSCFSPPPPTAPS